MAFKLLVRGTNCINKRSKGRNGAITPFGISDLNLSLRQLNSGQVFTALKPFFFAVHPDLFGQFPKEQAVNENSLKQLNAYIESAAVNQNGIHPNHLTFYLRKQNDQIQSTLPAVTKASNGGGFQTIRVDLGQKDVRRTVHSILQKCNISTAYLDSLPHQPNMDLNRNEQSDDYTNNHYQNVKSKAHQYWNNFQRQSYNVEDAERDIRRAIPNDLHTWLDKNVEDAKTKLHDCWPIREEIIRLRESLCKGLGLSDIVWDCGWGTRHFRGCLESFQSLAAQHSKEVGSLKGRKLIFGRETGVALNGDVILNSGEVRTNWLELISHVNKYDNLIKRIPSVQRALSRTLHDIQVVHRKFGPQRLCNDYESFLRKLITSLGDYLGRTSFPKSWPEKLSHLELVVESDAGPLMISPTGQIIVPASCPPFLLVNFITTHMDEASSKLEAYKKQKYEEKDLHERCLKELGLVALQKDDNVTPNLMIDCCRRLLAGDLSLTLQGTHLWITTYYSVLSDGELCIPWNWKEPLE